MDFLAYQHKRARRRALEQKLRKQGTYGNVVQKGPFQGMAYPETGYVSCRFQKIIGSYEHELHALIDLLVQSRPYTHLVNIGSADGYFTVGLARSLPAMRAVAYEENEEPRALLKHLASLNKVEDRIRIEKRCTPEDLLALESELIPSSTLVVCDVDGYEIELLAESGISWLKQADLLVETHDCLRSGVTRRMIAAFSGSHHQIQITNAGLAYGEYPLLRNLNFLEIEALVSEDRQGIQDWLFMTPDRACHEAVRHLGKTVGHSVVPTRETVMSAAVPS